MTPHNTAKSGTEHAHQSALFFYVSVAMRHGWDAANKWCETDEFPKIPNGTLASHKEVPALEWLHAIPNGGSRGDDEETRKIRGGALKAEGVKNGVPDVFLPYPCGGWHGLYIEFKRPALRPKKEGAKGGVSDDQLKFKEYAINNGYGWVVVYDWQEAANILRMYIEQEQEKCQ